jgi:MFS family permease
VYVVLAVVLAVLTVPLHLLALRPPWPSATTAAEPPVGADTAVIATATEAAERPVVKREFLMLAAAFTANSVCLNAVVINLVPLLHVRGYSATEAAWVLGIGGVGQVLGRLGYRQLSSRLELIPRTIVVFGGVVLTTAAFGLLRGPLPLLIAVAVLAGNARGLATLLSATAVSDRWGVARFARLNGVFAAPLMLASAVAPFVGAGLASLLGGYPAAFAVLAVFGAAGAALVSLSYSHGPSAHHGG